MGRSSYRLAAARSGLPFQGISRGWQAGRLPYRWACDARRRYGAVLPFEDTLSRLGDGDNLRGRRPHRRSFAAPIPSYDRKCQKMERSSA